MTLQQATAANLRYPLPLYDITNEICSLLMTIGAARASVCIPECAQSMGTYADL